MTTRSRLALGVCTAMLLAACGESNKVGSKSLINFQDEAQQRLGQSTPSPAPAPVAAATAGAPGKQALAAPTAAPRQASEEQVALTIAINDDSAGTNFDPSVARVLAGSQVRWVNNDKVPRSVESDTGAFASGMLQPGAAWIWKFKAAGKFNYHDGTRPYAVGLVEVVSS
jgi:plastocyanin